MSTADALLRAVIDRPDDDLPRLAYADFLEESGDPDRAEFVRVQVELARLPDHDPARAAHEDREHDLLAAHETAWLGDLVDAPGASPPGLVEWYWERGFVEEVRTTPRWMAGHQAVLFPAHPVRRWEPIDGRNSTGLRDAFPDGLDHARRLRELDFRGWPQPVPVLAGFLPDVGFDRLRDLDVTGRFVMEELPRLIARLPARERLEVLRCGGDDEPLDLPALAAALGPARLGILDVPSARVTAADLGRFLASPSAQDLFALDVRDNDLGPDAWQAFRDAPCRLCELDLSGTPLGAFALDRVLGCESTSELRTLELNRCGSAMANVRALAGSRFWRQAEDLRMHNGTIPARALDPLFEQPDGPATLRSLDLSDNYLYDAGVAELAAANWSGSLGWLALSRNYLTDAAARTIATSGRFAHLRTLHLSYNHPSWQEDAELDAALTEAGVLALADAPSLANLRLLALGGTALGPAGVEAVLNGRYWRLAGLGLAHADLTPVAARVLADSPRLWRLTYLDLSHNPRLSGDALLPLAESPYLCPLLELDIRGVPASDRVRTALGERLGRRLSE